MLEAPLENREESTQVYSLLCALSISPSLWHYLADCSQLHGWKPSSQYLPIVFSRESFHTELGGGGSGTVSTDKNTHKKMDIKTKPFAQSCSHCLIRTCVYSVADRSQAIFACYLIRGAGQLLVCRFTRLLSGMKDSLQICPGIHRHRDLITLCNSSPADSQFEHN